MKRLLLPCLLAMFACTTSKAQYFVADYQLSGANLVFSITPVGDITTSLDDVELFVRWSNGTAGVTFGTPVTNTVDFPGLIINKFLDATADAGYHNEYFYDSNGVSNTYLNGVKYELFRVALTGTLPPSFDLVADNNVQNPYWFYAFGSTGDYTPYPPTSPFVNPTGSTGSFFYKTLSLASLPIIVKTFSSRTDNCNAVLQFTTSTETNGSHFYIEHSADGVHFATEATITGASYINSYSRTLPFTSENNNYYRIKTTAIDGSTEYSDIILMHNNCGSRVDFAIKAMNNPVKDSRLKLQVSTPSEDELDIQVMDMSSRPVSHNSYHVIAGTSLLNMQLPQLAAGQYMLIITSKMNGIKHQQILVD